VTERQASIQQADNGRLEIRGDLSFSSVPALWDEYSGHIAAQDTLDIDLANVKRSDSAGLALLVECLRHAGQTGKTIRFFNMPQQMLAIASVSSLDEILPLQHD